MAEGSVYLQDLLNSAYTKNSEKAVAATILSRPDLLEKYELYFAANKGTPGIFPSAFWEVQDKIDNAVVDIYNKASGTQLKSVVNDEALDYLRNIQQRGTPDILATESINKILSSAGLSEEWKKYYNDNINSLTSTSPARFIQSKTEQLPTTSTSGTWTATQIAPGSSLPSEPFVTVTSGSPNTTPQTYPDREIAPTRTTIGPAEPTGASVPSNVNADTLLKPIENNYGISDKTLLEKGYYGRNIKPSPDVFEKLKGRV